MESQRAHKSLSLCVLFLHSFVFKVFPSHRFPSPSPSPFPLFLAIELSPFCTEIVYAILKLQLAMQALCGYFKLQSCHQMSACYISHNNTRSIFPIFQFCFLFFLPTKNCCTIFLFLPHTDEMPSITNTKTITITWTCHWQICRRII